MEQKLRACPVCGNMRLEIGTCNFRYSVFAYNVYCPECNFTGRSYKMRYKAIQKWNKMCEQVRNISR